MTDKPLPVWQVRSAYLPLLFLTLVLPWGAFALIMMTRAMMFVEPLFYFYLVMAVGVFLVAVRLIREKQSPGLFRAATLLAAVSAIPAIAFVGWMMAHHG
ncbi:hypothetical protein [Sphingomicrobium aestuariivivum]|uniref:hypothetical protein n=1 Tax=Sphingomicrobium aestuariivivum TaxID=1582356 RepID=UPI001FD67A3B|nr:hypothetical protein [Sphingomicrobium aestuariivivum]MCJ8190828.1 hypothetical protein [Sphingomicrobium aestuariivivum]